MGFVRATGVSGGKQACISPCATVFSSWDLLSLLWSIEIPQWLSFGYFSHLTVNSGKRSAFTTPFCKAFSRSALLSEKTPPLMCLLPLAVSDGPCSSAGKE